MRVFKATRQDMTCTMGQGRFQYEIGVPALAEKSQCAKTGLHACEYILDCMGYYQMDGLNRFFEAEAEGDIAEDGHDSRIACTKLTLKRELNSRDIAVEVISFIKAHPRRDGWECSKPTVQVKRDEASVEKSGIAIARGENPRVRGGHGAYLGFIRETEEGIQECWLVKVGTILLPGKWYTIDEANIAMKNYREAVEE